MWLEQLIDKLERAAKQFERRMWQSNSADLHALDMHELLTEAVKELKQRVPAS